MKLVRFAGIAVALSAGTVVPAARTAGAAATPLPFAAYGADASGTGVHLVGVTNALTNFRNGVIDNSFPLAATHLDASPATTATATVGDTGPAGGFLDFEANGKLPQTQYALAGFPGQPAASVSKVGTVATAAATATSADARSAVITSVSGGPTAAPKPNDTQAATEAGESHAVYDQAAGVVRASGEGTVAHASFGGGLLTIDNLTVTASVVTDGLTVKPTYAITAAAVKVSGTPVSVTDKGITIASPSAAADALTQQLVGTLNSALASAGLKISTTAPIVKVNGTNATVEASGITVSFTAPDPTPSIPSLSGKVILGEARAFAFATAGVATPSGNTSVVSGTTSSVSGGASTVTSPGSGSALVIPSPVVQTPSPPAQGNANTQQLATGLRLITSRRKPTYLLFLYLAWQALIVGTCAAVVWWRLGLRATATASE